jgi:hypothetical protein
MYKKTICCERSEQASRVKRVMESETHKDRMHLRALRGDQSAVEIHKAIIDYQFQEVFQPHWFGSIQWQPFITDYTEAQKEAGHFRNKFLCALLDTKPTKLPNPPERPRMVWFHEKAPVLINPKDTKSPKFKIAYHSHFHLGECPRPYDSWIQLDWLIRNKVGKGFHRLSTNNSKENKGFVLKPWIRAHHAHYNLKDYYRFKHQQDSDLVLDISRNSDLEFPRD